MLGHLIDDRVWMLKLPGQTRDRALSADQGQGKTGHLAGVDVVGIENRLDLFVSPARAKQRLQSGRIFAFQERLHRRDKLRRLD